jgi:hypothetical protein
MPPATAWDAARNGMGCRPQRHGMPPATAWDAVATAWDAVATVFSFSGVCHRFVNTLLIKMPGNYDNLKLSRGKVANVTIFAAKWTILERWNVLTF